MEIGGARRKSNLLRWGDGGGPEPQIEPPSGLKDVGYAGSAVPGSANFNWRWHEFWVQFEALIDGLGGRQFESLADAFDLAGSVDEVGPVPVGEVFSVAGMGAGSLLSNPGDLRYSVASAAVAAIGLMAVDSEHLYYSYSATDTKVHASDPRDGSFVWASIPAVASTVVALVADGAFVYAARANNTIYIYDRATGVEINTIAVGATIDAMDANGVEIAALHTSSLQTWDTPDGWATVVSNGTSVITGVPVDLVLDNDTAYIAANGPFQLSARDIQNPAVNRYLVVPPDLNQSLVKIAGDGNFLYITLSNSLLCLNREDGAPIWAVQTDIALDAISVDSRYIFCADAALTEGRAYDKTNGQLVWNEADRPILVTDNWSGYGPDVDNLQAVASQTRTEEYLRVDGIDPKKSFGLLAIPIDDAKQGPVSWQVWAQLENNVLQSDTAAFTHLTLPFSVPAGDYRIGFYYEWYQSTNNTDFEVQVQIDGAVTVVSDHLQTPNVAGPGQIHTQGGYRYVNLSAGTHTVQIDVDSPIGGTATMIRSRLEVIKVGKSR